MAVLDKKQYEKVYFRHVTIKAITTRVFVIKVDVCPDKTTGNDFITLTPEGILTISKCYAYDFASGPALDSRTIKRPSLVHDALYQLISEGLLDPKWREQADRELMKLIKEDVNTVYGSKKNKVLAITMKLFGKVRANYCYWAVRKFGSASRYKHEEHSAP